MITTAAVLLLLAQVPDVRVPEIGPAPAGVQVEAPAPKAGTLPVWQQVLGVIVASVVGSYLSSKGGARRGTETIAKELAPAAADPTSKGPTFRDEIMGGLDGIREGQRLTDRRLLLSDTERADQHAAVIQRLDESATGVGRLELRVASNEKAIEELRLDLGREKVERTAQVAAETVLRTADVARIEEVVRMRTADKRVPRDGQTPPGGVVIPPGDGGTAAT